MLKIINATIKLLRRRRGEEIPFNVAQTRQKFKRCINICRDAVMKVKTSSGIKRFQEDKELGSWFGKLLPNISSMDNCQPKQAIESGRKAPETNSEEASPEESHHDDDVCEEEASPGSSSRSSDRTSSRKRKYVSTPASRKKLETIITLKTIASDTSFKDALDFLKEKTQRQAARDDVFLKIMGALVQQPHLVVTSPVIPPMSEPRNQFRYGITNFRTNSSMVSSMEICHKI